MTVADNILAYMNARGNKEYTKYHLGAIRAAVRTEFITRDKYDIFFNARSKVGKEKLNKKIAEIANNTLGSNQITAHDVWIYKKCVADEYQDRTGKCAWGFKSVRKKLGYDPETGLEIV
ncbi:MAG: hypothetical protein E7D69_19805 [Clostridium celatum]|nr:hypothetical protein [Clostridium celatum]